MATNELPTISLGKVPGPLDVGCEDERLDLFSVPQTTHLYERVYDFCVSPQQPITGFQRQIDFLIPPSSYWTDLQHLMIEWEISIVQADGTALPNARAAVAASALVPARSEIPADQPGGPFPAQPAIPAVAAVTEYASAAVENSIASTLIKQIDFQMNQVNVSSLTGNYAVTHYLLQVSLYSCFSLALLNSLGVVKAIFEFLFFNIRCWAIHKRVGRLV